LRAKLRRTRIDESDVQELRVVGWVQAVWDAEEERSSMKIAIQGEPGSFSHEAALKLVPDAEILPCALSAEVFAALDSGAADAAAIPIENSLAGSVLEHFDLLLHHDVKVVRETLIRIRHNLIAVAGAKMDEIDRVYSHAVALGQCRRFLAAHPQMKAVAFYDTAGSVKQLVTLNDTHAAAIASRQAAAFYGAEILARDIEDNAENFTRFFLVLTRRRGGDRPCGEQDERGLYAGGSAGLAGGGVDRAERDGHQFDQDRVAPRPRQAVGVHLLCGLPDRFNRRGNTCP
jgi:prephenate dehydratase